MRIWIDATGSSQLLFFAPIARRLEEQGHVVTLTTRRLVSTDLVLKKYGLRVAVVDKALAGGSSAKRLLGLADRTAQLLTSARRGRFDVVVGSVASDLALASWTLGVPQLSLLDDEHLHATHRLNLRLITEIAVPDSVPLDILLDLGAEPERLFRFPGYREEYYLFDFAPDESVLVGLGVDRRRVIGVVRPPRGSVFAPGGTASGERGGAASLALGRLLAELCARPHVTLVVIARSDEQRDDLVALGLKNLVVAPEPVDSLSLIAAADFLLADAGVMIREAAALGPPAYILPAAPADGEAAYGEAVEAGKALTVGVAGAEAAKTEGAREAKTARTAGAANTAGVARTAEPPAAAPATVGQSLLPFAEAAVEPSLGALDHRLIASGRLRFAHTAADVSIRKKSPYTPSGAPRDPRIFVAEIVALAHRHPRRVLFRLGRRG